MSQIILDSANDLIQGDFDNATLSQRTRLQTSTINATTGVYVVPNGTANAASVQISNAADPTNASKVVLATNGSTDTQIISGANGSGTYLPLSIYTNNDIRLQVNNSGALGVRTGPGTVGFGTSGQFLTSNGSGAGVSWTTAAGYSGPSATVFTSPGTFTIPSTTTQIKVTVVGGGGSGGNRWAAPAGAASGGGAGGTAISWLSGLTGGNTLAVTVGAGGAAVAGDLNGNAGGTSSVASGTQPITTISATGGGGGFFTTSSNGGSGGVGSNGSLNISGGPGGATNTGIGNTGGNSIFGGGGNQGAAGRANSGGGGGGAGTPGTASNSGGSGVVIIEF